MSPRRISSRPALLHRYRYFSYTVPTYVPARALVSSECPILALGAALGAGVAVRHVFSLHGGGMQQWRLLKLPPRPIALAPTSQRDTCRLRSGIRGPDLLVLFVAALLLAEAEGLPEHPHRLHQPPLPQEPRPVRLRHTGAGPSAGLGRV